MSANRTVERGCVLALWLWAAAGLCVCAIALGLILVDLVAIVGVLPALLVGVALAGLVVNR